MIPPTATTRRMSADERREAVLEVAIAEFAETGLQGTSTERIAAGAGISHPYLFRLFGTKKELFLACVERCFDRTRHAFEEAAEPSGHLVDLGIDRDGTQAVLIQVAHHWREPVWLRF